MRREGTFGSERVPLARLFAIGFRTLIDGLHGRLAERGYRDVKPSFGFVLLAAQQAPVTVGSVAELMGVTKQAASKLVGSMEVQRYLKRVASPDDARSRPYVLSARGHRLLGEVAEIYADLEEDWAQVLGSQGVEQLREALTRVLQGQHGGTLPAVRPT